MEAMSPQQDHVGQGRSSSLTGGNRSSAAPEGKKVRALTPRSPVQNRRPGGMESRLLSLGKRGGEAGRLARFPSLPDPCRWDDPPLLVSSEVRPVNCNLFPHPGAGRCAAPEPESLGGLDLEANPHGDRRDSLQEKDWRCDLLKGFWGFPGCCSCLPSLFPLLPSLGVSLPAAYSPGGLSPFS